MPVDQVINIIAKTNAVNVACNKSLFPEFEVFGKLHGYTTYSLLYKPKSYFSFIIIHILATFLIWKMFYIL